MSLFVVTVRDSANADATGKIRTANNDSETTVLVDANESLGVCNILLPCNTFGGSYIRNPWNACSTDAQDSHKRSVGHLRERDRRNSESFYQIRSARVDYITRVCDFQAVVFAARHNDRCFFFDSWSSFCSELE